MRLTNVECFLTGTYTLTRSTSGSYEKGRYIHGPKETLTIRGSLQPIGGRDIKHLQENERIKDHFNFYSDQPLVIVDSHSLAQADEIQIDNEIYRVVSVEAWQNQPGFDGACLPHFKSIIKREPQQKKRPGVK